MPHFSDGSYLKQWTELTGSTHSFQTYIQDGRTSTFIVHRYNAVGDRRLRATVPAWVLCDYVDRTNYINRILGPMSLNECELYTHGQTRIRTTPMSRLVIQQGVTSSIIGGDIAHSLRRWIQALRNSGVIRGG